jgi:glutamine---fructose-6-phosphate transaminase (isomerizing)
LVFLLIGYLKFYYYFVLLKRITIRMCGIVGGVAERNMMPILLAGLRQLEYRGDDSAGVAVLGPEGNLERIRAMGKVEKLAEKLSQINVSGSLGIAHTRWATHGKPSEENAHPHMSHNQVAVVHNGIIENYAELKKDSEQRGYHFTSETDTEVLAHAIHQKLQEVGGDLLKAVQLATVNFEGAYALGVVLSSDSKRLIAARQGSPLVIGVGWVLVSILLHPMFRPC